MGGKKKCVYHYYIFMKITPKTVCMGDNQSPSCSQSTPASWCSSPCVIPFHSI